ncbi:uncharacterized protein LOC134947626 isoform X1 [Pseudophryne corroboree]|uniref:uncharacterized protein LOC134947626 isoform X1 n=1 Tax=Pseudophryne corroboree TaxID=495146 RepID=UPI00308191CB
MVSSVGKVPRSAYVCKKRYSDCKIAVKKKLSMMHLHSKKTGGGPLQIELCEWEQRLRNKISLTAVRGISEAIDTERPSSLSTSSEIKTEIGTVSNTTGDCDESENTIQMIADTLEIPDTSDSEKEYNAIAHSSSKDQHRNTNIPEPTNFLKKELLKLEVNKPSAIPTSDEIQYLIHAALEVKKFFVSTEFSSLQKELLKSTISDFENREKDHRFPRMHAKMS